MLKCFPPSASWLAASAIVPILVLPAPHSATMMAGRFRSILRFTASATAICASYRWYPVCDQMQVSTCRISLLRLSAAGSNRGVKRDLIFSAICVPNVFRYCGIVAMCLKAFRSPTNVPGIRISPFFSPQLSISIRVFSSRSRDRRHASNRSVVLYTSSCVRMPCR